MARQIEYDRAAMEKSLLSVFWRRGYAETSLSDLETATGLDRRQLYNGVGDKKAMFLQALDNFADIAGRSFLGPLEAPDAGVAEIESLLGTFLRLAAEGTGPVGCLVCSTSQEDIAADGDVRKKIDGYFERIRAAYGNALLGASARGEIGLKAEDLDHRTDALFATHVAICILARAGRPYDQLERMARQAIADIC